MQNFKNKLKKWKISITYRLAPLFILSRNEYRIYKILCARLKGNYKNILKEDSKFFYENLKKHIAWISSKDFIESYGDFIALCKDESISKTSDNKAMQFTPPPV